MRQIATHPGRMCSYFQCYSAPRLRAEHLGQALLGGRHAAFRDHLALLVQDAVTTASVAQIQPDGQPSAGSRFLARRLPYGVILLHGQSPFRVHLECVSLWERIASRRGTGLLIPSIGSVPNNTQNVNRKPNSTTLDPGSFVEFRSLYAIRVWPNSVLF